MGHQCPLLTDLSGLTIGRKGINVMGSARITGHCQAHWKVIAYISVDLAHRKIGTQRECACMIKS